MVTLPTLRERALKQACCFLAAFLSAGLLSAEDPAPPATVQIVVTATKEPTDDRLLTVPVQVTEPGDATTLGDALSTVPGLALQSNSPGETTLRAPTFGENGFGRVNFLIDGISQNRPDMRGSFLNLVPIAAVDHIETMWSPGSALYGDQSVVGAVNVVTKIPKKTMYEFSGSVENTLSNTQSAFFGTPLDFGGFLLAVERKQSLPTRQNSQSTEWNLWSKFLINPMTDNHLALTAAYSTGTYQLPGSLTLAEYNSNPDSVEEANSHDNESSTNASLSAQWDYASSLLGITLPASLTVRNRSVDMPSLPPKFRTSLYQSQIEPRARLEIPSVLGGDLALGGALGGSYQRLDVDRDAGQYSSAVLATLQRAGGDTWVSVQQNWDDTYVLSAQARYELSVTAAHSDQSTAINHSQTFTPLVYSVGFAWIPQEETKLALNAGRTFRYPFLDDMVSAYGASTDSFNTSLQPETGWDLTLSGQTPIGFMEASTSAKLLWMDNEIVWDTGKSVNTNSSASVHGMVDANLTAPFPRLPIIPGSARATLDYTLEQARLVAGPYVGNSMTLVPAHTFKAGVDWSPNADVTLAADGKVVSSYFQGGDDTNTLPMIEPKFTYDASTTFHFGADPQWTLKVYGRNLSDDRTPDSVYWSSYSNKSGYYPTEGRVFGAQAKTSF